MSPQYRGLLVRLWLRQRPHAQSPPRPTSGKLVRWIIATGVCIWHNVPDASSLPSWSRFLRDRRFLFFHADLIISRYPVRSSALVDVDADILSNIARRAHRRWRGPALGSPCLLYEYSLCPSWARFSPGPGRWRSLADFARLGACSSALM